MKCERRLQRWTGSGSSGGGHIGQVISTTVAQVAIVFRQSFASAPAFSRSGTVGNFKADYDATNIACSALAQRTGTSSKEFDYLTATVGSAVFTVGEAITLRLTGTADFIQYSCEL